MSWCNNSFSEKTMRQTWPLLLYTKIHLKFEKENMEVLWNFCCTLTWQRSKNVWTRQKYTDTKQEEYFSSLIQSNFLEINSKEIQSCKSHLLLLYSVNPKNPLGNHLDTIESAANSLPLDSNRKYKNGQVCYEIKTAGSSENPINV